MARRSFWQVAMMGVVSLAGPAAAQPAETWTGTMHCDALPGRTQGELRVAFSLTLVGNEARYERNVRQGSSGAASNVWERGGGTLGPDRRLTLVGSAAGRQMLYSASYEGRLGRTGGRLTGEQLWGGERRACTISLRRPDA